VAEFNGLVSKRAGVIVGPFACPEVLFLGTPGKKIAFTRMDHSSSFTHCFIIVKYTNILIREIIL